MGTTVHVGVLVFVVVLETINHHLRALRRSTVIEPDERMAVDLLRKNREIATDLRKVLGTDADGFVPGIGTRIRIAGLVHGIATERCRSVNRATLFCGLRLGNNLRGIPRCRRGRCRDIAELRHKFRFGSCRSFHGVEPCIARIAAVGKRCRRGRLVAIGRKRMFPVECGSLVDGSSPLGGAHSLSRRSILHFGCRGSCSISTVRQVGKVLICQLLQFSRIGNSGEFFQRSGIWIIRNHSIRQPLRLRELQWRRRQG